MNNLKREKFLERNKFYITPSQNEDYIYHYKNQMDLDEMFLDGLFVNPTSKEKIKENFEKKLNNATIQNSYFTIIDAENGNFAGFIDLYFNYSNKNAEMMIKLDKNYRIIESGISILNMILEYVFNYMGLHKLSTQLFSGNLFTIKLIEELKFRKEGVLRQEILIKNQWYDIIKYSILKKEYFSDN